MCGICGIVHSDSSKPVERGLLEAMTRLMTHRGPDGEGYYLGGPVGLGHRRLSVIDTEGGAQPMTNEDRSLWLVYNGEIYNFRELAEELKARGHRFETRCDTEVILHLYEEDGVDCLSRLKGMFSFALWDDRNKQLFCARDRLGVKPFYYSFFKGSFVFASGPEPIVSMPDFQRSVDRRALDLYLTYQYVPSPLTIFSGVEKLQPAHYLLLKGGKATVSRYWDLPAGDGVEIGYGEAKERLRSLISEATRLRLVSDVPLGAFLSGGIDSSIVVALMSGFMDRPVKTFSIGFEDMSYNELPYARILARRYSTDHHEFTVRPRAVDLLPKLVRHYGEPFADSSALPTYYVAEMTRSHVTVALNGDAGDELFAGYPRYLAHAVAQKIAGLPFLRNSAGLLGGIFKAGRGRSFSGRMRRFLDSLPLEGIDRYRSYVVYFNDEERNRLYSPEMRGMAGEFDASGYLRKLYESCRSRDELSRIMLVDLRSYLPEDLLVKVDIATMANSLESRSPFLDHRVVEFASALPSGWKLKGSKSKYILKDAFSDLLPAEILSRGKMGFGVPVSAWFRAELKDYLRGILLDGSSLSRGYFDSGRVAEMLDEHQSGQVDHGYRLWALLVLELWHREFIDGARSL